MRRLLVGLLGATILVAGCGDDGERVSTPTIPGDATSTTAAPDDTVATTTESPDRTVDDPTTTTEGSETTTTLDDGGTPTSVTAPTDTRVNEAGDPLTLDQAGDLACANAEFAQDSLLEGDTETAAADVSAAAQRAAASSVPDVVAAGVAVTGALDSADPLRAVQTFLTMCTDHGYEL